jgi:hypothetical protein
LTTSRPRPGEQAVERQAATATGEQRDAAEERCAAGQCGHQQTRAARRLPSAGDIVLNF